MALIVYGPARYAELTRMEPPMSMTAVEPTTPLVVDGDRLGAGEPELLDEDAHVASGRQGIESGTAGQPVLQLEGEARPGDRDEARGEACLLQLRVEPAERLGRARVLCLEVPDAAAEPEDVRP